MSLAPSSADAIHDPLDTDYPITEQQVESYRANGFIVLDEVLAGPTLAALRQAVEAAVAAEKQADVLGRARAARPEPTAAKGPYEQLFIQRVNLWRRHPAVRRFVLSPRLGNLAAKLAGCPVRLWHDQALFKEPGSGNNKTPWHQDAVYWPHQDRHDQITIWIALKDATTRNGCMSFVGGTQVLDNIPPIDLGNPQDIFRHAPHIKPVKPLTCELSAGSATFHNGLTFHYAGPNKSEGVREAMAIIYMPDGTTYDGQKHIVTDPLREKGLNVGDKLEGELFPVVGKP
jgi:ectoine hydroxylase-related dioxygenase (phytanoyl-CoA dioxygenase family)